MKTNMAERLKEAHSFTRSLAPRNLSEVQGQEYVVARLRKLVKKPYPASLMFAGATGTGKSCTARALAGEFGCDVSGGMLRQIQSGFYDLCASSLTIGDLDERIRSAWYAAMNKTGWKVFAFSEADKLKDSVLDKINYALDNPPPNAIWIFTTNAIHAMDRRFVTRCETIHFESDAEVLMPGAQKWVEALWRDAGQEGPAPEVVDMPGVVQGGHFSYRSVVVNLQGMMEVD